MHESCLVRLCCIICPDNKTGSAQHVGPSKITALTLLACLLGAPVARAGTWNLIARSPNGKLTVMVQPHSVKFVRDSSGHWTLTGIIEYDAVTGKSTDDGIYLAGTLRSACQKGFGVLTEITGAQAHMR